MRIPTFVSSFLCAAWFALGCADAAPSCRNLAPTADPEENYKAIVDCLSSPDARAQLAEGAFSISRKIKMPARSTLSGAGAGATIISAANGYKDNSVIQATDGNVIENLGFVGGGRLTQTCCTTVVSITGSGSQLERLDISDGDEHTSESSDPSSRVAGLYFIGDSDSSDNVAKSLKIHDAFYGVIFRKGLRGDANNRLLDSEIFGISCDSMTFAGGGSVEGNHIHDTGFNCKQKPPIPGGGFYALNNSAGIVIANNTMTEVCGSAFDIVGSEHIKITGNKISQRKLPFGGRYPYCHGTMAGFVDDSNMTIEHNDMEMIDTLPLGVSFKLHPAYAHQYAAQYAPIPDKERQIIGVRLLQLHGNSNGNRFVNNRIVTECSAGSPCAGHGIALYIGPGAGEGTPNTVVDNTFIGTGVPALFCGSNKYQGNTLCTKRAADGGCAKTSGPAPTGACAVR